MIHAICKSIHSLPIHPPFIHPLTLTATHPLNHPFIFHPPDHLSTLKFTHPAIYLLIHHSITHLPAFTNLPFILYVHHLVTYPFLLLLLPPTHSPSSRIYKILPQRIEQWKKSPCIAEEHGKKMLERIHREQQDTQTHLKDMERHFHELEAIILRGKQQAVCNDEEVSGNRWGIVERYLPILLCTASLTPPLSCAEHQRWQRRQLPADLLCLLWATHQYACCPASHGALLHQGWIIGKGQMGQGCFWLGTVHGERAGLVLGCLL